MTDISKMKERLEQELAALTGELKSVGRVNPDNAADWEATPQDMDIDSADENIVADKFEEYENNTAMLKQLETRYNEVKESLGKMGTGKYGLCDVCGKEIDADRLEANPAANTCREHMG